jgi:hypothetical protein
MQVCLFDEQIAASDVVWTFPSENSLSSMPLGNGDLATELDLREEAAAHRALERVQAFYYERPAWLELMAPAGPTGLRVERAS